MFKINRFLLLFSFIGSVLVFSSCEKEDNHDDHDHIVTDNGLQARLSYTEKGYTEVEKNPIVKINCYHTDWDKDIMTPVSGLFEYYDTDGNWVASINFGDGSCDQWATKTWDVDFFPDYPSGISEFSVFSKKNK